jgi:DNA-binding response OmpR family regulator
MRELTEVWEEAADKGVKLTPCQAKIVQVLENGKCWTYEALKDHLWGSFWPEYHEQCIKIHVYNLRRKGYKIENAPGIGYRMRSNG